MVSSSVFECVVRRLSERYRKEICDTTIIQTRMGRSGYDERMGVWNTAIGNRWAWGLIRGRKEGKGKHDCFSWYLNSPSLLDHTYLSSSQSPSLFHTQLSRFLVPFHHLLFYLILSSLSPPIFTPSSPAHTTINTPCPLPFSNPIHYNQSKNRFSPWQMWHEISSLSPYSSIKIYTKFNFFLSSLMMRIFCFSWKEGFYRKGGWVRIG